MKAILVITGDGGECYEALYAVHRFREAGYEPRIAAPSRKRLHLVMHDFEPGWDTYVERQGYQLEADLDFSEVRVGDYDAVLLPGGRAPEYLRNDARVLVDRSRVSRARQMDFCHLPRRSSVGERRTGHRRAGHGVRELSHRCRSGRREITSPISRRCGMERWSPAQTWQSHPEFYREVMSCLGTQ